MGHAQGCSRLSARRDLVTYSSFLSLAMVSRQVVFCCQYWGQLPLSHCGHIVCVIPEVDDMDGYQDDGYEEAILPTDFVDGRDGDYSVICTNDLHDARASSSHGLRVRTLFLFLLARFYWASHRTWLSRWLWTWIFKCVFEWSLERSLKGWYKMNNCNTDFDTKRKAKEKGYEE